MRAFKASIAQTTANKISATKAPPASAPAKGTSAKGISAKASASWATAAPPSATKASAATGPAAKALSEGQLAYETKRAAKAGMTLDKWLNSKQREKEAETRSKLKATEAAKPPKPPGFFGRLLERAHRPLGS